MFELCKHEFGNVQIVFYFFAEIFDFFHFFNALNSIFFSNNCILYFINLKRKKCHGKLFKTKLFRKYTININSHKI